MTQWTVERLGRKGDGVALAGDARALAALTLYGRPDLAEPSLEDVFVSLARTRATGAEEAA